MRVHVSRFSRARFCIAIALAYAAVACGGDPTPPDASVENVAFAPGQGAVHGFVDVTAVNVVALPDAWVRLKRVSDNLLTPLVKTDVHGAFVSSNVAAGTYVICISGTTGFANACSQTQFVVTSGKVAYPPHAVFSPMLVPVYGRVRLSDGNDVRYENQLYGKFVDTYVRATTPAGALVSGPVRANSRGQYVLRQVPPGTTVRIIATSETITVQNTIMVVTSAIKQDFTLPNRRPIVAEVQVLQNGKTVRHVSAGAVVRAKVIASDPDGNALHYQWKAPGGSCPATDAPEVDCTMPLEQGVQSIYVQISDGRGQYQIGRARVSVGAPISWFSGKTITNGNAVVANAEIVINGVSTMTNGNGKFAITVPEAKRYVFTIKKDGFQTISKIFLSEKVGKTYKLLPAEMTVIDPTKDNTIIVHLPQGQEGSTYPDAKVTIKKNSIIDSAGNKVLGPVNVFRSRFEHLFDKFDRMPGDTGAVNAAGKDVTLTSLGALEVNLRGPAGQKYNIAPGMPSDLEYGVHPSQVAMATPTIPLWYYNEQTGLWEQDGIATLVGGVYKAQAKHFSAINVDLEKVNATCLKLVVDRTTLTPPFKIRLSVPGYPVKDRDIDEDIEAIMRLPPNVASSEIVVLNDDGSEIANSKRIFTTGNVVPDGTNLDLASPYNECITPPSPPVTLTLDLPQNPSVFTWLSRVSNDETYADNYYIAINAEPDLTSWLDRNDFDLGEDAQAFYFNAGDLEFGRSMHMKRRADGSIAYYVTNFADADKALNGDPDDVIATVAMEYSNYPLGAGNPKFTKFYVFNKAGVRVNRAELDNRGDKFVPGLCIVCHGGTLPADILAANGDTSSKFIPFDLKSFDVSPLGVSGFPALLPRAAQEENFRKLNEGIYLYTNANDTQKAMLEGLYPGGVSLLNETQHDGIDFIPVAWQNNATNKDFYNDVVRPSCRACHMQRDYPLDFSTGTAFTTASPFSAVCQTGYMPQSFVTWRNFWQSDNPNQPSRMEDFLGGTCTGP